MTAEPRFLKACRRESVDRVPVWFMRQAGRYMPEYRRIREKHSLLEICKDPALAVEVTLQPVRALPVDAAILFTDLLIPLEAMGVRLTFEKGEGPVLHDPVREPADVGRLLPLVPERQVPFMLETVRRLRKELDVPLIGFAGAPFTLASYLIEGGHSRHFELTKRFMLEHPLAWSALMKKLAEAANALLKAQVKSGAQAVQLFDSWVGCLSPEDYREYVQPYSKAALSGLSVPTLHFGTDTATLLEDMAAAGGDVIGVDWRTPLASAFERLPGRAIQGNLDPVALLGPLAEIKRRIQSILSAAGRRPGFIFNLGHGILPQTPVAHVRAAAELVHFFDPRAAAPARAR